MTRWRYIIRNRIIGAQYALDEREWLDHLGQDGWELVTTYVAKMDRIYIFKRPAP